MKKWDLIIIIVLIILSLMPIRLLISNNNSGDLKRVIISVNGEEYESLELKENLNKICINKGQVYMNHSNCTDKVCMRQGKISKIGESIVCLPNRVFIEIKGDEEVECILSY